MRVHYGIMLILFVVITAGAADFPQSDTWERQIELRSIMFASNIDTNSDIVPAGQVQKASGLSILFSTAVPGAGQLYTGSWIKGIVFLAAEVALWTGSSKWNTEGQDLEDQFHDYVDIDNHWNYDKWHENYNSGTDPSTHHLPRDENGDIVKTQQYYEMIGKYNQFKQGWSDWTAGGPDLTPRRDHYETMRYNSNRAFIKASYCTMAILGNHLISALDAVLTYKRINARARMNMAFTPVINEPVICTGLALSW
ncbi:hypothetical protein KAR48_14030 [bacterium]|nr:hypothetical protein [bacterium]